MKQLFLLLAILFLAALSHAQTCGPPDYAPPCSITDTAIHPYPLPIPNWGPNTACMNAATTLNAIALCGNLTGAGTVVTSNDDFHAIMTRCTDVNTDSIPGVSNPVTTWQTADAPSINLWNTDHSAMLLLVNGGNSFVFLWDGTACHMLFTAPGGNIVGNHNISFPAGTTWSRALNNVIYSIDNTTGPGVYLQSNTVTLAQDHGSVNTSTMFDWSNSQCLLNPVNGFPTDTSNSRLATVTSWSASAGVVTFQASQRFAAGQTVIVNTPSFANVSFTVLATGLTTSQFKVTSAVTGASDSGTATATTFPLNEWNGALFSQDGIHFAIAFSLLGAQGGGFYQVAWAVGQSGCDLYNTKTGVVTHNGTLVGTVPDTQWGGAYGGLADRFTIHDSYMSNPTVVGTSATSAGGLVRGTYNVGDYFWVVGTTSLLHCGLGAPNWKASTPYVDGNRVVPLPVNSTVNPGGYIFQIINGISGNTGSDNTIFKTAAAQTPGSDTVDGAVTWRNVGIGSSTTPYFTYDCSGHTWKGYTGLAAGKQYQFHSYADPQVPRLNLGPTDSFGVAVTSPGDQHLGNTYGNTSDTFKLWVTSTDAGTTTDLLHGPFPGALYMENFFVGAAYRSAGVLNCKYNLITCNNGTLGNVSRFNHCYGTGWHKSFDVQNCIAIVSQDGQLAMQATDLMGQLGNTSGAAACNPGGPAWTKTDSVDYPVGTVIYPILSNDSGNYLYKVQSCSGTCQTGTTQPDWSIHQQSTVAGVGTFVDGTITWQGAPDVTTPTITAKQNCRSDVVIINLTRGSAPPAPPTTAPALTMFTKLKNETRKLWEFSVNPFYSYF